MDMSGEKRIPAPRDRVWEALNDPEILRQCIPGCETLERNGDDAFTATAAVRIGPVAGRFKGNVQLTDIVAPESYRISGEGNGGVLGFAKGGADVRLDDDSGTTVLKYVVQAQVGGKMAQLGARLVDSAAKNMADQFFDRFTKTVGLGTINAPPLETAVGAGAPAPTTAAVAPAAVNLLSMIPDQPFGYPRAVFIGGFLMLGVLFIMFVL